MTETQAAITLGETAGSTADTFHQCLQPEVQAVLVLRQGYIPEKSRANQTQNSHLKQCISWGLGD
jgi:hypothetical protein